MYYFSHLAILALALFCGSIANAEPLFFDSFESGNMSGTNEDGFKWSGNNRTSVVTMDPLPLAVYQNGVINNYASDTSKDWTAKTGDYALRFRYAAADSGVAEPEWTEQRFSLGGAYPEIWIQYWTRVPLNYATTDFGTATNHKFFAIWMDGYEGHATEGPTVAWEMWPQSGGSTVLASRYRNELFSDNSGHQQHTSFIAPASDNGRWMEITLHVKASSSQTAPDGVIEMWRRWEDEASPVKFHTWTTAVLPIPSTGPQGWSAGYFFGWNNAPYAEETEWLIDHITISKESLLTSNRPNPPGSIYVD